MPKGPQRGNQVKQGNAREVKTKKIEPKVQPKTKQTKKDQEPKKVNYDANVVEVLSGDTFRFVKVGAKEEKIAKINRIIVPQYNRVEKKEEQYSFEAKEFLRQRIIGKKVHITEMNVNDKGVVFAEVTIGNTDIAKEIVKNGWAYSKAYKEEEQLAKDGRKGVHEKGKAIPRPQGEALNLFKSIPKEPEFSAVIKQVIGPAHYVIYTKDRKEATIKLLGVSQCLEIDERGNDYYIFDEDGANAMEFIEPKIYQRDVRVRLVEQGDRYFAVVKLDGKDLAELLLKEGYVVVSKRADLTEEMKEAYTKAEREAKKLHKNRWTDFDQALEDKMIKEKKEKEEKLAQRKEKAKFYIGDIISIGLNSFTIKVKADSSERVIRFASLRPTKYDSNNKEAVKAFRRAFKEIVRKYLVGKKFQCKETYVEKYQDMDGKNVEAARYDVYINKKNFGLDLVKSGLFRVIPEHDPFKQSFEYEQLLNAQTTEDFKYEVAKKVDKDLMSKAFPTYKNRTFICQVEMVSLSKFSIYIPEKNVEMKVFIDDVYVPSVDNKNQDFFDFRQKAGKEVLDKFIGVNEVKVSFGEEEKRPFNVTMMYNNTKDVKKVLIDNYYVAPRGEKSDAVKKAMAEKKGIYAFYDPNANKPKQEGEKKENNEQKNQRPQKKNVAVQQSMDLEGNEKQFVFAGFDCEHIYYYEDETASKYVDEIEGKLKALKKEPIKEETKNVIVEYRKKFYRGEFLKVEPSAYEVECKDIGLRVVCGKNKLRCSTEEIDKLEVKVKKVGVLGIRAVRYDFVDASAVCEYVVEHMFKPVKITLNKKKDFAKAVFGESCLNVDVIANGFTVVDKSVARDRS